MTAVYEIGPFRLDAATGMLAYGDAPTPLGRRGVAVLEVLVARAHEFVAKQDILDLAWPGVVVEESNLAAQISAIRRALAQAPDGEGWIETLSRRGYRFVGPVTPLAPSSSSARRPARGARGSPQEWERRHLASLSLRLRAAPGVELAPALAEIAEKLRRFGGQVEDSRAAGLVAVFGFEPTDNAPELAAQAALAIRHLPAKWGAEAVAAIDGDHHLLRLQRGRFEISEPGRAALRSGFEALAPFERPGTTGVSAAVLPFLRRRFALERPDAAGPWLLLSREPVAAAPTPFAGRSAERAKLAEAAALAAQGQAQVVGVVGEAGVGKSRLLRELAAQLQDWRVLEGSCAPYAQRTPYFALAQVLRSYCRVHDADGSDDMRGKVAAALLPGAGDPALLLPALFDVLGVLPADDASRAVDPALRRRRTHDALRQFVLAASAAQPLCLIVDDLQWVDVETREVLDGLVNGMARSRLLLTLNYRPEFQHAWGHRSNYRQLHLDALSEPDAAAMLDALLGADPGLAPLKRSLAGLGNPFYLEETARSLVETGTLQGPRGDHRLVRAFDAPQVPPTVQAILAARVDRLTPDDRRLLQIASTIDKEVPLALLQAIADRPEEPLRRGLQALQAADFLHQTGLHPHITYSFKHALTHEVTYASVPPDRRRALHARLVGAIELAYPDRLAGQVDALAHHAVQGELWDKALRYLRQAGVAALARAANGEAARHFDQALAALAHLPPTRDTQELAIDLRFDSRTAFVPLGEFERIFDLLQQAEALAAAAGDRRRLGEACGYLCHLLWMTGRPAEGLSYGQRAQALAESLGDLPLQVLANLQLGATLAWMGCFARAEACLLRVLQLLDGDAGARRFSLAGASAVAARAYLSQVYLAMGRYEEGRLHAEQAIRLAQAQERAFDLANARLCLISLLLSQGEFGRVVELLEPQQAPPGEGAPNIFTARAAAALGRAYVHGGRPDEGIALIQQALRASEAMRYGIIQLHTLHDLAEAYVLAGRAEEALECSGRAIALSAQGGQRANEAGGLYLQGRALRCLGRCDAAQRHVARALELATELGMRPLAAHCHAELGQARRSAAGAALADAHLGTARAMYDEMGMRHWAQRAGAV